MKVLLWFVMFISLSMIVFATLAITRTFEGLLSLILIEIYVGFISYVYTFLLTDTEDVFRP